MKLIKYPAPDTWEVLTARPVLTSEALESSVINIMNLIRELGDQALINLTNKFDGITLKKIYHPVPKTIKGLSANLKRAINTAFENISTFHQDQMDSGNVVETMPGVNCWRKSLPIEKVGLYVPGGSAPLFSTMLMLGIPAQLAGCRQMVVCTPPQKDGTIHPALMYIAQLLQIEGIYAVGGAQAVAAMAFGTETVPSVYKIFGPGNQYVTEAKRQVAASGLAIDFPAGPSEVAILGDATAQPKFIAADLLSQAEHGADSQVMFATDSEPLIQEVLKDLEHQLISLPRREIAQQALNQSKMLLFKNLDEAMDFINNYAPEHFIINTAEPLKWADKVINAGSVFLGPYTPESVGDYASGTNHTLPTDGNARMYAGVSLDSFVKKVTFQQLTPEGLNNIGPAVELMAKAEGLEAHRRSVSIRREYLNRQ
ncbi:MAG: histidinol dehydrogenase [Cyclobacteriaceae bacterium]|nr:histidinol dehydrogenase [Cyclobacteriaceae bacterium]